MTKLICTVTSHTFSFGPVTIEIAIEGLKITVTEPVELTLPWGEGGMELSEWLGRLID